jgi:hypothetical protein
VRLTPGGVFLFFIMGVTIGRILSLSAMKADAGVVDAGCTQNICSVHHDGGTSHGDDER